MAVRWKKLLTELCHGAGKILLKHYGKIKNIEYKPNAGIVTEADKASEKYLLAKLLKLFPKSTIITEETGPYHGSSNLVWHIDPLDGTTNYAHGFPWFCISIAVYDVDAPLAGAVFNPVTDELFLAEVGAGATLNGKKISVSKTVDLKDCLLGTGFYYTSGQKLAEEIQIFGRVQNNCQGVRRPGSAAMDLAYVACGRYDGFWERGLKSWDVAAGRILVEEAGGSVSNYSGQKFSLHEAEIAATNKLIHPKVLSLLKG